MIVGERGNAIATAVPSWMRSITMLRRVPIASGPGSGRSSAGRSARRRLSFVVVMAVAQPYPIGTQ